MIGGDEWRDSQGDGEDVLDEPDSGDNWRGSLAQTHPTSAISARCDLCDRLQAVQMLERCRSCGINGCPTCVDGSGLCREHGGRPIRA